MTFDKNTYIAEVLKKQLKAQKSELQRAIRELQETGDLAALGTVDVAGLLAVTPNLSDIRQHLTMLRQSVLNKRKSDSGAVLLARLLEILEDQGCDLGSPAFWTQLQAAKGAALKKQIAEFGKAVSLEHQALKVVTEEELVDRAETLPGASVAELRASVEKHGVAVRPAIVPPSATVPRVVQDALKYPEFRTVVDVLLLGQDGSPHGITVIDNLSHNGGRSIGPAEIESAQRKATTAKDSDAMQIAQKVLTLVKADFAVPAALHEVVFTSVVSQAKALLGQRLPSATAVDRLVASGLERIEAARIVAHLTTEASSVRGLGEVTELVAAGAVGDARRMLDAIGNPDQYEAAELERVTAVVEAAEHRKRQLLEEYEAARTRNDFSAAAVALGEAVRIDIKDERLAALLRQLPPPTPDRVTAKIDPTGGVRLSWRFEGADNCSFVVVRGEGTLPTNPGDGVTVATLKTHSHVDTTVTAGKTVEYAVFAVRDGVYSLPGVTSVLVLPTPTELTLAAGLSDITATWRVPSEAVGVRCTLIDAAGNARPVDGIGSTQVTVTGLQTGQRYRIVVEAIYVLPDGARRLSDGVAADATPRGAIGSVEELLVREATLQSGKVGLRASWPAITGFPVELWALPIDETLPPVGSEIDLGALDGLGARKISGVLGSEGTTTTLEFAALSTLSVVVAVTVDGDRAVVGPSQIVGSAPAPKAVHADRFGDELVVSWEWPHGDYASQLSWCSAGRPQTLVVSRADYRRDGGVRLSSVGTIIDLEVATVAFGNGREWTSVRVPIPFERPEPVVSYQLRIPSSRFGKRKPVEVSATSAAHSGPVSVVAVVRSGKIMPTRVEHDDIALPVQLDFSNGPTAAALLELPKISSPFWVRLFPTDDSDFILQDPPTEMLKG
ncbi:hypothetical protein [Rhodococcus pyridinivorans]|uniref:hypothetical protein n=1 Tax=Rhodococcus pyridinivorans TaxID=103816 RepID=UPI002078E03B|nr:hypothetical protein [Rhodococcus pyridinivorans]USI89655.1 hypothetical protein LLA01_19105 [Rhodococcus pyridinivorans]